MHVLRWITGTPIAALVTAALFAMMAAMISQPVDGWTTPKPRERIVITAEIEPNPPYPITPPRPKNDTPPPTEIQKTTAGEKPVVKLGPPAITDIDANPGAGTGLVAAPLIRVAPAYPERCRGRGAEGTVLVQFDVAANGSVVNPVIIESADRCFNRTVLKAVSGWKYPPAMRAGKPAPRYGVAERFSFELAE